MQRLCYGSEPRVHDPNLGVSGRSLEAKRARYHNLPGPVQPPVGPGGSFVVPVEGQGALDSRRRGAYSRAVRFLTSKKE